MKLSKTGFGAFCLWASILFIYGLLFYKIYVLKTKGIWPAWTVGDYLPDSVIRGVFSLKQAWLKDVLVRFLWLDLIFYLLPFPILIFLLDQAADE